MNFEFVDFYPEKPKPLKYKKDKRRLGTVHVYLIKEEMDIRGIVAIKAGQGVFFNFPHFFGYDEDKKENVSYPHIRYTNNNRHKELLDFLHEAVKPEIKKRLLVDRK